MTYDEMIAVLQAAKAGKVIEVLDNYAGWTKWTKSGFDFLSYKYRVKPEPKRCWVQFTADGSIWGASKRPREGYTEMVEVTK